VKYAIARTATNRPTFQHRLVEGTTDQTLCGRYIGHWSRYYSNTSWAVLLCKLCHKKEVRLGLE
jgi:hypothetical protein